MRISFSSRRAAAGRRRAVSMTTVATTVATFAVVFGAMVATASSAFADPGPIQQRSTTGVTADALPTVQIDGVAWSETVVGNTVYVGGNFANARPAGAAPGTNLTPRGNLLAFDITTGNLITSFAPSLNGQVKTVVASPDGSRIYVGGSFTSADGQNRYRIAAYSTSTGQLLTSFAPTLDATVNTIYATNTTVYAGGIFSQANGVARSRLAAFSASNGALLAWAPTADLDVDAMVMGPNTNNMVIGGAFTNLNGSPVYGLGAVDATTGASVPWQANTVVQSYGGKAAFLNLTTDGNAVYATSFNYGGTGNLEGVISANPATGALNWIEDCHGDTYQAFPINGVVYTVSHAHFCANDGGWPVYQPWRIQHSVAFTANATGTLLHNSQGGYYDFYGQPSPSIIDWFPNFTAGTFTGQSQATWSVSGNSQYLVEGGEFPSVNGVAQQGLVRFAVPSIAPNKIAPQASGSGFVPSLLALSNSSVRVAWQANWDMDDLNLTYAVARNGDLSRPIYTTTQASEFWNRPTMGFVDTGLTPGATYQYRLSATDPSGNKVWGDTVSITMPTVNPGPYAQQVLNDGASNFWRLSETSGTTAVDWAGGSNMSEGSGVGHGAAGSIIGDPNGASTFSGTSTGQAVTTTPVTGPNNFTIEAWFNTTTTQGGKLVGFGDGLLGSLSGSYDRQIYMDNSGHLVFGVYNNGTYTVQTPNTYNNGQWHQVVATFAPNFLALYVDGQRIAINQGTANAQPFSGYWHIGGDNLNGWPSQPSSNYFAGTIDDVSIYPTALTEPQIATHYTDGGYSLATPVPTDTYGQTVYGNAPESYWRLADTSGNTAADSSGNNATGTYFGGVTLGTSSPVSSVGAAATFNGRNGTVSSTQSYVNPTSYSEELWFNTTTTRGGRLTGFSSSRTGSSGSSDRLVYMLNNGQLSFGVNPGSPVVITSPGTYNDGKWHHLAASQGSAGLQLWVDGQLVASNSGATSAGGYNGYWRLGGDTLNGWPNQPSSSYFAGTLDESAIYLAQLSTAQVRADYRASPASVVVPPTASFTTSVSGATVSFDGTGSTDPDGTIVGYSWNFGDGSTASTATPSHTYAASGTYPVTLTVTDDQGATGTTSQSVTVVKPNQPPVASFTSSVNGLTASFDGTASSDPDGTVASWAWNFGDGTTGTGSTTTHAYSAAGTYTVTLTVTDNQGATNSVQQSVTVANPNQPPVASFTSSVNGLTASFDGTASSDPDGTVASWAWNFGDGTTGTGSTTTHAYSAAGTYTVTLTVTDNQGATNSVQQSVTVQAPAQPPVPSFTQSCTYTTCSFDGSGSTAAPGATIASYAWDFGDGATGTGSVATTNHTYSSPGTYTVTLTVTDSAGQTASKSGTVTVQALYAADTFTRTLTNQWGTADTGGAWTVSPGSAFSVDGSVGHISLSAPGAGPTAYLNSISQANLNAVLDVGENSTPTGGGVMVSLLARHVGTSDYRFKVRFMVGGVVHLVVTKVVNGTETTIKEVNVNGLTYTPGTMLTVRMLISGSSPTTIAGRVWPTGTTEPTTNQISVTDSEPSLQGTGAFGVQGYLTSSATNAPVVVNVDNLTVTSN